MKATRDDILTAINYAPGVPAVYVLNPKAACSSAKASLWAKHDELRGTNTLMRRNVHDPSGPFIKNPAALAERIEFLILQPWFSIVRNPYARLLSAYLNKISRGVHGDRYVWTKFTERYRIPLDAKVSFLEFLHIIRQDDPHRIDPHFRPQWINLMVDYLPLNFIGRLEHMQETARWLTEQGITPVDMAPHKTDAANKVQEHFSKQEIEAAQGLYERDFELFGYPLDPSTQSPTGGIASSEGRKDSPRLIATALQ